MPNFTLGISFADEDGHLASTSINLVRADLAALAAAAETIVEAMDILSDGRLAGVSATIDIDTTGWTVQGTAGVGSDVEIGGRMIFRTAGSAFFSKITIPAFLKDAYTVVGGLIDPTIADVAAFILAVTGNGVATNHWEDIVSFDDGYEVFNGKR